MAKRKGFFARLTEEDERPAGALRYADPSTAEFPRHIHTFNEPYSEGSVGECDGIRSTTGKLVPWEDRHVQDTWAEMARKKGTLKESD